MTGASPAVRPLVLSDWTALRDLRLLALRTEPALFSSPYDAEASRSPEEWHRWIAGPGHQIFGLFDGGRLAGITGVVTDHADPAGGTALLVASFLLPEYRGRGLSRLFYEARLEWVRARPAFARVVVSHRESNEASRRANRRHGFRLTGRKSRRWPDGKFEDELFYERPAG